MVKHNNIVPNVHFHKYWERFVSTWFDQASQKKRRRLARQKKAARIAPRPVKGLLRPVVHAPTAKYNLKLRYGRGFTLDELKEAGVDRHQALGIGISVDHRRTNKSERSFQTNVQRLKAYKSRLILFPRNRAKFAKKLKNPKAPKEPTKGQILPVRPSSQDDLAKAAQLKSTLLPIKRSGPKANIRAVTEADTAAKAFFTLRQARADARLVGIRKKKAAEKADAASFAAKK